MKGDYRHELYLEIPGKQLRVDDARYRFRELSNHLISLFTPTIINFTESVFDVSDPMLCRIFVITLECQLVSSPNRILCSSYRISLSFTYFNLSLRIPV